jgi:hypothetical protein
VRVVEFELRILYTNQDSVTTLSDLSIEILMPCTRNSCKWNVKSCVVEDDGALLGITISSPIGIHARLRLHGSSEGTDNHSVPKRIGPRRLVRKASMNSYLHVAVSRKNGVLEKVSIGWPRPTCVVSFHFTL